MNIGPAIVLAPISSLYSAVVRARTGLYRAGLLRVEEVSVPVISVGNITVGGTGKTPIVEWLARRLAAEGRRVCILTRGYGRRHPSRRVLVSDGQRLLAGVHDSGDEPQLLAEALLGISAVVCDANRVAGAKWIVNELGSDLIILDDGFQHLRIKRDLDILTIDATDPWGGNRLLPAGRLREPLRGISRAGVMIITRSELSSNIPSLRERLGKLNGVAAIMVASTVTSNYRELNSRSSAVSIDTLKSRPVLAFCGVGNPVAFFEQVKQAGWSVHRTVEYRDHYFYNQHDIDRLEDNARRNGIETLITTTKDAIKLRDVKFSMSCFALETQQIIEDGANLISIVKRSISAHGPA
jgi:tetraacyldisaccharide 4'-kinase